MGIGKAQQEVRAMRGQMRSPGQPAAGRDIWESSAKWEQDSGFHPHEANLLLLNSEKARTNLGWRDKLNFEESVRWTIDLV